MLFYLPARGKEISLIREILCRVIDNGRNVLMASLTGWVNRFANAGDTAVELAGNTAFRVSIFICAVLLLTLSAFLNGKLEQQLQLQEAGTYAHLLMTPLCVCYMEPQPRLACLVSFTVTTLLCTKFKYTLLCQKNSMVMLIDILLYMICKFLYLTS